MPMPCGGAESGLVGPVAASTSFVAAALSMHSGVTWLRLKCARLWRAASMMLRCIFMSSSCFSVYLCFAISLL